MTGIIKKRFTKAAITGMAVILLNILSFNAGADFNIDVTQLEHPYILFNKANIPGLVERTQTPPYKYIWDNLTSRSPEQTGGVVNAFIYAITGDEERGNQAREELFAVVDQLPHEGGRSPKLNISSPIGSAGLIYDMIYDLLTPDERLELSEKMAGNGIVPLYNHTWDAWWGKRRQHNYSPVFNAAYGIAAAAILKENPGAMEWIERAAKRVQLFLHSQDPAGGFGEGVNYWCMSMRSIFPFMDGLQNLFDIDLYNNPYLTDNTGLFVLYTLSPDRRTTLNFNDAGINRKYDSHLMTRMARIYPQFAWVVAHDLAGHPEGEKGTDPWPDKRPDGFGLGDMYSFLWYDARANTAPLDELPRSCFFPGIGWTVMRTGWDKNALQFGIISAPKFFGNHEHADRGSIILNAYGERLIIDAGKPYTYGDPIIENWFRGSAGHNLLHVNGEGQTSRENLSAPGRMSRFVSSPSFDYVFTENAGPYNGRVNRWDRHAIFAVPEFVILFDQVELPQPGELEFRYLSPGSREIILKEDNTSLFPGDNAGPIPGGSAGRYNSEKLYGSNYTETDWWKTGVPLPEMTDWTDDEKETTDLLLKSFFIADPRDNGSEVNAKQEVHSGYQDYRLPATYLTQTYPNVRKANFITVLYPRSADMKKQKRLPQITDLSGDSSIGLKITRDQKKHLIVGYGEAAPFTYASTGDFIREKVSGEQLSSNADFASAVFDSIGSLNGYIMINGTELIVGDDTTEEDGQVTALHADLPLLAIADFDDTRVHIVFEVSAASGADLRIKLPKSPQAVSIDGRPIFADMTPYDYQGRKRDVAEFHIPSGRSEVTISYENGSAIKKKMQGSTFSEAELINIRNGFDKRVNDAFAAEQGKPLKRARVNPPLNPGRPSFSRGYSWSLVAYATRCFWLNEQIDSANYALIENADFYLADPKRVYDRDNFHWHSEAVLSLVELFGQNGTKTPGLLKPETENKILEATWLYCKRIEDLSSQNRDHISVADHQISNTWYIYESENHHVQSFSTLWHFAKLAKERANFRDRLYDDGLKAIDHYNQWNDYIKIYLAERAKKGMFIEMMCVGYNTDLIKGVFNFYDFAEDEELKRRAGMFLDLYFAYWGQEQLEGISGGGKSRVYNDTSVRTSGPGYFFFGVGDNPGVKGQLLTAMTTNYRPSLVVVDIVRDTKGRGVYEVIQRPLGLAELNGPPLYKMRADDGGILRYSYCTPSFIMGTPMVESRPYQDWASISSQNRSHGVIFEGPQAASILPQCEKSRAAFNTQWSVQRKGTLICQKLKTNRDAGKTRIWFSGNGLSDPTEEKGWVFTESNGAFAALKIVHGSSYWEPETNAVKGKWLVCENDYSPVILEVVQKTDFKSFQEFKNEILAQTIDYENNVLNYKGIYGDQFTFYADFSHSPRINNVPLDYAPSKALDSPFLQAEWNSGVVTVQKGKRQMELNFNTPE